MSTTVGKWFEWTEDHPLEIIRHRSRLVFHNTSGCVSWETEGEEEDRLWSGPEWDAFCDAHENDEVRGLKAQFAEARTQAEAGGRVSQLLLRELNEAKAVLRELEWEGVAHTKPGVCGSCMNHRDSGHAPDCHLAKAIGE